MPVTIVAVPGAANANSYTDVAVFDAYCNDRLNAQAGRDAGADDKARALIEATRELTVLLWRGRRSDSTQALAWPRQSATNPDDPSCQYFDDATIPQRIIDATCELALQFLRAGDTDLASLDDNDGVIRKKIDVLETQWAEPQQRKRGLARFPRVMDLIRDLIDSDAGRLTLVRA